MEAIALRLQKANSLSRVKRIACPLLIIAFCLLYSSLYFLHTFPISESWTVYYVEMILHGNVPYRDFYYYLPPLNLLVDFIFWKLSFGYLVVYRCWYLLQRIVMLLLLYRLLCRYFTRRSAFLAVSVTSVLLTACVYDLFGDYNQTMAFLAVTMLYPVTAFAEKKKRVHLFLAGVILGLMFLNKQPIFVASGLCWFLALTVYCIRERDWRFPGYCLTVTAGAALPLSICCLILAPLGALLPFLEQVYLHTEGKGSLTDILFVNTFRHLRPVFSGSLLLWFLFAGQKHLDWRGLRDRVLKKIPLSRGAFLVLMPVIGVLLLPFIGLWLHDYGVWLYSYLHYFFSVSFFSVRSIAGIILIGVFLWAAGIGMILAKSKSESNKNLAVVLYLAFSAACAVWAASLDAGIRRNITTSTLFSNIYLISPYVAVFCLLTCLYGTVKKNAFLGFLSCGAFALYYAHAMGSGSTPPMNTQVFIISLPVCLCVVFDQPIEKKRLKAVLYGGICGFCALAIVLCAVQKKTEPYSWWGQINQPEEKKTFQLAEPAMAGFRLTYEEAEMYDEITELIRRNTDEEDEVWGYPYIRIFNILSDRYVLRTFVPVLFPDVVGDDYVLQALELIREHKPELVLWKELPNALDAHERVFRDGEPLIQRELEAEFQSVIPEEYQLLGYYHGVQVYRRKEKGRTWTTGNLNHILELGKTALQRYASDGGCVETHSCSVDNPLSFDTPVSVALSMTACEGETTVLLKLDGKTLQKWDLSANESASELEHSFLLPPGDGTLNVVVSVKDSSHNGEMTNNHLSDLNISCKSSCI